MNIDSIAPEDFLDRFCPVLAFDPERNLFELEDQALAFGFICYPLTGYDQKVGDRLGTMLNQELPPGSLVQVTLHAGPDIQGFVDRYENIRDRRRSLEENKTLLQLIGDRQTEFLTQGIDGTLISGDIAKPRDIKVIITVRIPTSGSLATPAELEYAAQKCRGMGETLHSAGLWNDPLKPGEYIRLISQMLTFDKNAEWRHDFRPHYNPDLPIRNQIAEPSSVIEHEKRRLVIGDYVVKTLSVKRYPETLYFGFAYQYLADALTGTRGIRDYCMFTMNMLYGDSESERSKIELESTWVTTQSYGWLARINPRLAKQKASFDAMQKALSDGDRPIKAYLTVTLFGEKSREQQMTSNAVAYMREQGFSAMEDVGCCLPQFLNSMPMFADPRAARIQRRYHRMATRHATALLPVFADWKGNSGTAPLNFISRKGQLMGVDMFAESNNAYNGLIFAESGAGKSFLTNEIALAYLSMGGRVWILDAGRSYMKLAHLVGGQYIEFSQSSDVCINPFQQIKDFKEEADILLGILLTMAYPNPPLNTPTYNFQIGGMREILSRVWNEKGINSTVDDVIQALAQEEDLRLRDLATQMFPFSSKGEYGRFFNGPNNMRMDAQMVVIELEDLKHRKHLQRVVLFQMMNQIANEMFLSKRESHRLCIIDEAWDLLSGAESGGSGSSEIQQFINGFYRKLRKHGGGAIIVTQTIDDVYASSIGTAIVANSPNTFILRQKAEIIERAKEKKHLALPDGTYDLMKTITTVRPKYSEVMIMTGGGTGIGRLIVPRYKSLLYSTNNKEYEAINTLVSQGLNVDQAINRLIEAEQTQSARR
ncbi:MAG: type IV secretion system protein TraC [Rhizobium sp.]|nr:MAG: type IV secretion system protein TraC [Rhizobium sp.]